jgi:hypothetical protein
LAYAYQLVPYLAKTKSPHGVWRLRHSGSWIPQKVQKAREAFGESRFRGPWQPELLRREVLSGAGAPDSVHLPVTKQFEELVNAHYNMPGLERSASAWVQRVAREEARMLERVRREFAHREAVKLRRLDVAAEALMPSGILQERVWTHFDLVEHGGLSAVGAYFKAYAEDSKWDEPGWWEFR